MTDTLFYVPPCDSPRLRWMKKYRVTTIDGKQPVTCELTGRDWGRWSAGQGRPDETWGDGPTELEAITDWAIKHGVRLWNEEKL